MPSIKTTWFRFIRFPFLLSFLVFFFFFARKKETVSAFLARVIINKVENIPTNTIGKKKFLCCLFAKLFFSLAIFALSMETEWKRHWIDALEASTIEILFFYFGVCLTTRNINFFYPVMTGKDKKIVKWKEKKTFCICIHAWSKKQHQKTNLISNKQI